MNRLASPGQLRADFIRTALFVVPAIVLLGVLSGRLAGSGEGNPWFAALVKPAFYPPGWIFGAVWTTLYILMGLALAMVLVARGARRRRAALIGFGVQFAANLAWSPLFFAAHRITGALVLAAAMAIAVAITIALFRRVRPLAAALLVPYLAWVCFAVLLTWEVRRLNPAADGAPAPRGAVQRIEV